MIPNHIGLKYSFRLSVRYFGPILQSDTSDLAVKLISHSVSVNPGGIPGPENK